MADLEELEQLVQLVVLLYLGVQLYQRTARAEGVCRKWDYVTAGWDYVSSTQSLYLVRNYH
jgi:hypothetical protein